jgi:TonB-dependent SusC/RagA subfamily outer membrane receptor
MKLTITMIAGLLISSLSFSQTRVVHGKLTCFNTYPVRNVEIKSKKAKSTTVTDSLGHFSIVCLEKDMIQIKPKAFKAAMRRVDKKTDSLIVNLLFNDSEANREIAVGYGYMRKADLLYAVENLQVQNNDFCNYSDIYELLRGRFAGVEVTKNGIYIRGSGSFYGKTQALILVDGVATENISWVVPCQVNSVDVLKDQNAAIYGSRGANGVVVITTRKGI